MTSLGVADLYPHPNDWTGRWTAFAECTKRPQPMVQFAARPGGRDASDYLLSPDRRGVG
jgi:hypothetical protein